MTTIAYDLPVLDLISGLDATKHVTHTQHRKTKVTLHHNGGRLTHNGVLSVWQSRPASAHFNVDAAGTLAQFVKVNEYAWATGNTQGNQESISIEMCNLTVGPDWLVADATWRSAARLAGWLFAKVIGVRPNATNLVQHKYWSATACAGPHIDRTYGEILWVAQQAYDEFSTGGAPSAPSPRPPTTGGGKSVQQLASEVIGGEWGNGDDRRRNLQNQDYNYDEVQAEVNRMLSGSAPSQPPAPPQPMDQLVDEVLAGSWGNDPERRQRLLAQGHDASAVQNAVNLRLAGGAPSTNVPGVRTLAAQVIRGEWSNGDERRRRLEGAGHNYAEVQAEVNRQLGY